MLPKLLPPMFRIGTVFGIEGLDFGLEGQDLEALQRDLFVEQQAPLLHGPDVRVLRRQDLRLVRLPFFLCLQAFFTPVNAGLKIRVFKRDFALCLDVKLNENKRRG